MNANIANIDRIATAVNAAIGIFTNAESILEGLQPVLIDLLTALEATPSKRDVKENPDLIRMFERTYRGIDRAKLVAWFAEFSPIRVKIDQSTGRFEKIGWKNEGKWDVEGAKLSDWFEAKGAADAKSAKTGEYSAARKALAKVIARKLYAETGGTEIAELKSAIEAMREGFFEGVLSDALDTIRATSWNDWTDAWDARVEKERQIEAEKSAKEKAAKAAKDAEIAAAMQETRARQEADEVDKMIEAGQLPASARKGRKVANRSTATH